jgi:hypothetical protein
MDPIEERRFVDRMKRQATSPEQVRLCEIAERSIIKECGKPVNSEPVNRAVNIVNSVNKPVVNKPVVNKPKDRAAYMREYMRKRREEDEGA